MQRPGLDLWALALLRLLLLGGVPVPTAAGDCVGYELSGAGSPEVDGCYSPVGPNGSSFAAAPGAWRLNQAAGGIWQLINGSGAVFYRAANGVEHGSERGRPAPLPPTFPTPVPACASWVWPIGWDCGGRLHGRPPQPAVRRLGLPPPPEPAPVPPPPPVPAPATPTTLRLVMDETFDGPALNSSRWRALDQVHHGGVYQPSNVILRNGSLVLRTVAQNQTIDGVDYFISSGAVNTSGLLEQRYGRWSARVKLPKVNQSPGYVL